MIQAVSDIIQGRKPVSPVPRQVNEYFMLKQYPGMSLEEIRAMSMKDFNIFSSLASTENKVRNDMDRREMKKQELAAKAAKRR